ncbi:hypothetical protein EDI_054700 [Entamoeba dispar SAW760]|uniref:Geminivirus AL1 replication-associated protein catalytic domain-containing protein n=1 Tax=Entamoeba dispar (strain ATCC PRA-260 / SAW760) TaxID=370354 RepID=B0EB58_ENTDS|nr:uncharacterized protein EDI_054700 [Entamoeba dispar SAW760]EDR28242.1 hypothetical protein EDI_054700 [Entamoeba dispar SAW760]|eukprot:EDR28242.1 hypothetical protein EDI_054700 [Entamoeba dispar SAW760]
MHGYVTLNLKNNTPVPSKETIKNVIEQWCTTRSKKAQVKYLALSKTTKGNNRHVHAFFELEDISHVRKRPFVQLNNEQHFMKFEKITENKSYDGSFKAIIDYLKKQGDKHPDSGAIFEEMGKMEKNRGRLGDIDLGRALKMPT